MSDTHRPAAAEREGAPHEESRRDAARREFGTETQKKWHADNEKRGEEARHRGEEMAEKRTKAMEGPDKAAAERDRLTGDLIGLEQAAWPYYGLFPAPEAERLHVIPAGMWRYQEPQTPAFESMIPPSEDADPNFQPTPEEAEARDAEARRARDAETARMTEPTGAMPSARERQAAREANHAPAQPQHK